MRNKNAWIPGESLLTLDAYDVPGLLAECNEGRFQICDEKKEKIIVPIALLKPLSRVFGSPTTFIIDLCRFNAKGMLTACHFQRPSDPALRKACKPIKDCWQKYSRDNSLHEWRFNIPDQLCDYNKLLELKLHPNEKYPITFKETVTLSGPNIFPDPANPAITGTPPFAIETIITERQMHIWFEYSNEDKSIAWFIDVYGAVYRSVDLHVCVVNDKKTSNGKLSGYEPSRDGPPRFFINISPLEQCVKQVMNNCGIDPTTQVVFDLAFTQNLAKLRNLIMDTDYVYTHPGGLPPEKYESFIFDEEHFAFRYYYFAQNKGYNEFVKKIKSFHYKPTNQENVNLLDKPVEHANACIITRASRPNICFSKLEIPKIICDAKEKERIIKKIKAK